jgi:hypothetical protein
MHETVTHTQSLSPQPQPRHPTPPPTPQQQPNATPQTNKQTNKPKQVVFGAMMFLKALSYSLNNPCKEMLYNPTSTDVKFKAKSWIDIFGQRGACLLSLSLSSA